MNTVRGTEKMYERGESSVRADTGGHGLRHSEILLEIGFLDKLNLFILNQNKTINQSSPKH